jgi:hypothetical protein
MPKIQRRHGKSMNNPRARIAAVFDGESAARLYATPMCASVLKKRGYRRLLEPFARMSATRANNYAGTFLDLVVASGLLFGGWQQNALSPVATMITICWGCSPSA